ncbi:hypothetical protein E4U46_001000 [Claviceps purpurea]|nr:hypothetical protein E4U12_002891 [Claviceps purpurea]KAG6277595.1 hypothetical protein E4U46_001000 [Claviceps purpurea]
MKFNTVLGTFALSTLQAYLAYASPVELDSAGSPETHSLEVRGGTEYCCVASRDYGVVATKFVPWDAESWKRLPALVKIYGPECGVYMIQGSRPPSQGGCADWVQRIVGCDDDKDRNTYATVEPASLCQ